jgi:acetyl esterase/lipase
VVKWLLPLLVACNGTMESYFAQDVVDETLDQPYADGKNPRQYLDLFTPRDATGYPVVVFVHGGYWIHQDRDYFESVTGLYHNVGIALARHGIGVATISYRLVPDVPFEDELDDVALATQWTHDHIAEHGGDPSRIVIAGHSAGGHIAALLAVSEERLASRGVDPAIVRGYIPLSPIVDLPAMAASSADHAQIAAEVFGDALAEYSPVTYASASIKPELFGLGTNDEPFIAAQVPPYLATLQSLGAPVQLVTVQGATHDDMVLNFDGDDDQLTSPIVAFVDAL